MNQTLTDKLLNTKTWTLKSKYNIQIKIVPLERSIYMLWATADSLKAQYTFWKLNIPVEISPKSELNHIMHCIYICSWHWWCEGYAYICTAYICICNCIYMQHMHIYAVHATAYICSICIYMQPVHIYAASAYICSATAYICSIQREQCELWAGNVPAKQSRESVPHGHFSRIKLYGQITILKAR